MQLFKMDLKKYPVVLESRFHVCPVTFRKMSAALAKLLFSLFRIQRKDHLEAIARYVTVV